MSKPIDIVVYGSTGFTGDLVMKYLHSVSATNGIKFAVGGRSRSKMEQGLKQACIDVPVLIADSGDEAALVRMVKQTRLVISLVGPYASRGMLLVKACAENGVHYVDLAAEPHFSARMMKLQATSASATRALIIHSCGYDSVPSDLCAYLAVQKLQKSTSPAGDVGRVVGVFKHDGGYSFGTLSTIREAVQSSEARKSHVNPYVLSPVSGKQTFKPILATSVTFGGVKTWAAFYLMSTMNSAVVRQSWGLLEYYASTSYIAPYGPHFVYEECIAANGPISALCTSLILYMLLLALAIFPPAQWALDRWGPKSGEGPSLEMQKKGWFSVTTTAKSVDETKETQVVMTGKGDPGYSCTSKIITECALAIVKDYNRLPPLARQGGFLTPATGLGNVIVERLEATKCFAFSYSSPDKKDK